MLAKRHIAGRPIYFGDDGEIGGKVEGRTSSILEDVARFAMSLRHSLGHAQPYVPAWLRERVN